MSCTGLSSLPSTASNHRWSVPARSRAGVWLAAAGCVGVMACAPSLGMVDKGQTIRVYRADGSRQCEPDSGAPPTAGQRTLAAAGIPVLGSGCGHDGRVRIALCGVETGLIHLYDIPANRLEEALALGFRPLSELPAATVGPCPEGRR